MDVVLKKKKKTCTFCLNHYSRFKSLQMIIFFFLKEEKKSFGYFNSRKKKKKPKCPTIFFRLCSVYKNSKLKIFKFSSDTKIRSVP